MQNLNVYIPYADFTQLQQDSGKLASVIAILNTEFPDDTCQLIAIKSVLGIEEKEEETPVEPIPDDPDVTEPSDPNPDDTNEEEENPDEKVVEE